MYLQIPFYPIMSKIAPNGVSLSSPGKPDIKECSTKDSNDSVMSMERERERERREKSGQKSMTYM